MTKPELALLEKAYAAEIDSALKGGPGLIQTKAKLATQLVAEGFLRETSVRLGGRFPVEIRGYELTQAGRLAYCTSC